MKSEFFYGGSLHNTIYKHGQINKILKKSVKMVLSTVQKEIGRAHV